jgi:DNA-binding CsgD family transcriptional regulator
MRQNRQIGLLDRKGETGLLDRVVRGAASDGGTTALIEGPAGMGKSRLLAVACEMGEAAGYRVLAARAGELERDFAFGVVRQAFDAILTDPENRDRLLSGSARPAARVFEPPAQLEGSSESYGILHGLFWLTANLASVRPLLLAIDDLHWCDLASLRFVAFLQRRLEGLPILVVATSRPGPSPANSALIAEISLDPATVAVRPGPLSREAVEELIRLRLGASPTAGFLGECHWTTAGNPLLVVELLKFLAEKGVRPDENGIAIVKEVGGRAVSRSVSVTLARLPTRAASVARMIAVLGEGAALPVIATLAGVEEEVVAEAVTGLVRAEILSPEPPFVFVHPLVRDAVYLEIPAAERALWHDRAATALLGRGAPEEEVAKHLLLTPPRGSRSVVTVLRSAGLIAANRGDATAATAYLRRALAEAVDDESRPRLLLELGSVEAAEDAPAAADHVRQAYNLLPDPALRGVAARILARMLLFTGTAGEAVDVARQAIADLDGGHEDQRRTLEAFELYAVAFGAHVLDASARLAEIRRTPIAAGVGARILAAVAAWDWSLSGGSADQACALALAALADGTLIDADPGFGAVIAGGVLGLGERDEALKVWDDALERARRIGSLRSVCMVNIWRGWTWLQRGMLEEAELVLREALDEIAILEKNGAARAYITAFLTKVLVERGDQAAARMTLRVGGRPTQGSDSHQLLWQCGIELDLLAANWEQALTACDRQREDVRLVSNPTWAPWRSLKALALHSLGRNDEALTLIEHELADARTWGAPGSVGRSLRVLGTLRRRNGLDLLAEAVELTTHSTARLEHAKALAAFGSSLRRAGHRIDARRPLRLAVENAEHCGARTVASQARAELAAAGGRPRRVQLGGPASLTPSESRIAGLAAAGQTNREIAEALFVTPKTVEVHLTSVYRKLGIKTRADLKETLRP